MKINRVRVFQVDLPLVEGQYKWSGGKSIDVFDSTVVELTTDTGLTGYGEACPLGPSYLPAYAAGVRAGIAALGPDLIGCNPLQLDVLNRHMDHCLAGHPYVKSAIDMASWDLLGKACDQPVAVLLGGHCGEDFVLYRAISQQEPDEMAARVAAYRQQGYRRFQLKVGGDPDQDIERIRSVAVELAPSEKLVADANTGWTQHEAARVVDAVADINVYIEQPCPTYEQCAAIRNRTARPFILDESIHSFGALLRGIQQQTMDVVNLKISRLGGITRLRQFRDTCVACGIAMTIEDSWGGDIVTAAIAHVAHSTPPALLFSSTDFNSYVTVQIAAGAPQRSGGRLAASREPGLGIQPDLDILGQPVLDIS